MDIHSPEIRSYNMRRIRNKNTKPEMRLRKWLWDEGYRYRLHVKGLPGKPDIVFKGRMKLIFVHGCFFHKHNCRYFKWPATRADFWRDKIESNVLRDETNLERLHDLGWKTLVVWECETRKTEFEQMTKKVRLFLDADPSSPPNSTS